MAKIKTFPHKWGEITIQIFDDESVMITRGDDFIPIEKHNRAAFAAFIAEGEKDVRKDDAQ